MSEDSPVHSVSVAAAVADASGRLRAVRRRDNGRWEPPGGVLELDETIHDGVVREVLEETSLTVEPEALTGVYKNMPRGVVALVFRCRALEGVAQASAEAAEVAWLTEQEIAERMDEAYATRLLDALRPGPPAVCAHDGVVILLICSGTRGQRGLPGRWSCSLVAGWARRTEPRVMVERPQRSEDERP